MSWVGTQHLIFYTEYERVYFFVGELRLHIQLATQCLVTAGRTFAEVSANDSDGGHAS